LTDFLLIALISVGLVHIGIPFAYFLAMSRYTSRQGYGLDVVDREEPTVTILVPTYNEASVIEKKLQNLSEISYPKDKIQLLLVDGASNDDTVEISKNALKTTGLNGTILQEKNRKGKSFGLNLALKQASGELICISDAECTWDNNALKNATRYFTDSTIGSVSGIHQILGRKDVLSVGVENSYRSIYRMLRIAESKIHSTPIAEGEIQLLRRNSFVGFDTSVGGDDTSAALGMVEKGLRAIAAEDVIFYEPTPSNWHSRFAQKIRRGQHIFQAFVLHRRLLFKKGSVFSRLIFPMEFFFYVINPILFIPFVIITFLVVVSSLPLTILALLGIIGIMSIRGLRNALVTYVSNNLTMLAALFQELRGRKQLTWTKIQDTRTSTSIPVSR
jgi:cellulose synthase/poly-beta-1,6-N-acetylglucosamine synthase-like glycosyltransferase